MKTTWPKIVSFSRASQAWLSEDEKNKDTKLGYAIKRVTSQLEKLQAVYMQQRDDISIEHAAVDAQGVLLTEPDGRLRFTPEKMKERNRDWRVLDAKEAYEIEPHFATDVPATLSDELRELMIGFVVKEEGERLELVVNE